MEGSRSDLVERGPLNDEDPVITAVKDLAAAFGHHPGFMWTESAFEVLHADWPAYPLAHGLRAALYTLADYPASTRFFNVDNIDACTLFSVNRKLLASARNPEHLWVAVWDDDLKELSRLQLVDGISGDDEGFLSFAGGCLEVSSAGRRLALVYELTAGVHPEILDRVDEFLRLGRFDTAVREASILVEQALRSCVPHPKHQSATEVVKALFERQANDILQSVPSATVMQMKAEFLKFFAYVRNEFAHRLGEVDVVTASRLLRRCSRLLRTAELFRDSGRTG
jgi:hypothetical protein